MPNIRLKRNQLFEVFKNHELVKAFEKITDITNEIANNIDNELIADALSQVSSLSMEIASLAIKSEIENNALRASLEELSATVKEIKEYQDTTVNNIVDIKDYQDVAISSVVETVDVRIREFIDNMGAISKELIPSKQAEAVDTTQYTATNVIAVIDKFTVTNTTGGAVTLSINLVQSGGSVGVSNLVVDNKSIAANTTCVCSEVVGHILAPGSFISTNAGAATSLTIRCSGREIT